MLKEFTWLRYKVHQNSIRSGKSEFTDNRKLQIKYKQIQKAKDLRMWPKKQI